MSILAQASIADLITAFFLQIENILGFIASVSATIGLTGLVIFNMNSIFVKEFKKENPHAAMNIIQGLMILLMTGTMASIQFNDRLSSIVTFIPTPILVLLFTLVCIVLGYLAYISAKTKSVSTEIITSPVIKIEEIEERFDRDSIPALVQQLEKLVRTGEQNDIKDTIQRLENLMDLAETKESQTAMQKLIDRLYDFLEEKKSYEEEMAIYDTQPESTPIPSQTNIPIEKLLGPDGEINTDFLDQLNQRYESKN